MSIQSAWSVAGKDKPAAFETEYASIKVQAIKSPDSDEIQVRIATEFNTDWQEARYEEWYGGAVENSEVEERCEDAYEYLKEWRCGITNSDELAVINALIKAMEQANSGLIRG